MSNTTANTTDEKLHIAITELVLDLKKDGTVGTLASKLGVSRNRLTTIFRVYDALLEGKEVPRSKTDPRPTPLCWDLDPLINISKSLGIQPSDLIRAAEDVQNGLPPWFHARISENTQPQTRTELVHIFLEAAGCRTYAMHDPLRVKGARKSFSHYKRDPFARGVAATVEAFINTILSNGRMNFFIDAYEEGIITSEETYLLLKTIFDPVVGNIQDTEDGDEDEAFALFKHLLEMRCDFINKICLAISQFLKEKKLNRRSTRTKK